jgi:hypothetical protein
MCLHGLVRPRPRTVSRPNLVPVLSLMYGMGTDEIYQGYELFLWQQAFGEIALSTTGYYIV